MVGQLKVGFGTRCSIKKDMRDIRKKDAMPNKKIYYIGLLLGAFVSHLAHAMVYDNRFIPLLQRPRLTIDGSRSEFAIKWFMTTANKSLNDHQQDVGLSEIFGIFDQVELAKGIAATGQPNPLPSEFQGILSKLPWDVNGKRQSQGIAFKWDQSIIDWLSTGFSWLFMRVESRHEFKLNVNNMEPRISLKPGEVLLLDDNRRQMFKDVGIRDGNTAQLGFGDIDWYLRFGNMWEYTLRFRRIDAGFRLGALIPTGVTREPDRPASIPFGGNGHWGVYGAIDALLELKEDWKAGFLFRVNKRFAKTRDHRMPVEQEPSIFGAVVGPARVSPGVTIVLAPYFMLENLRKGLALGLNMTLTWHQKDSWTDMRADQSTPVMLNEVEKRSEWKSEYFTFNIIYDFGKVKIKRDLNPIVTFRWDIPSTLFIAGRVNRTHRVTFGLDFVF